MLVGLLMHFSLCGMFCSTVLYGHGSLSCVFLLLRLKAALDIHVALRPCPYLLPREVDSALDFLILFKVISCVEL